MKIIPQAVSCAVGRHEPDRRKVEWDGIHYVGNCTGCGVGVYRVSHKRWRTIDTLERGPI